MKCSRNHKYFPKSFQNEEKENAKCFLCGNKNKFPFYECKYCKELICSECSFSSDIKQNSCNFCSNELTWRKCIYTTCDRCHHPSECFYYCICCDYSFCINCIAIPKGYCGGLHKLQQFDIKKINSSTYNQLYFYNFYEEFNGKCSKCNGTIGQKVFACLRCALFLCEKCMKKNEE